MPRRNAPTLYTIGELAAQAGLTRRTVRFYVEKGVLSPPVGAGRGARYTERHLAELERLAEAKARNMTLDAVARFAVGPATADEGEAAWEMAPARPGALPPLASAAPAEASRWCRIAIADGVELHLREDELTAAEREALRAELSEAFDRLRPGGRRLGERKRGE